MDIDRDLDNCRNLFDVAAILYQECEDRLDDRRFHLIEKALHTSEVVGRFVGVKDGYRRSVANAFAEAEPRQIADGVPPFEPVRLISAYRRFLSWLIAKGVTPYVAAWSTLRALDESFTGDIVNGFRMTWEQENPIAPLNSNHTDGYPAVYLKIPSRVPYRLSPLQHVEHQAWANLEYLALTERPLSTMQLALDTQLWSDLIAAPVAIAAISPKMEPGDFPVEDPPPTSGIERAFWIRTQEPPSYREQIVNLLQTADDEGATIAMLPELSSSELLEREVAQHLAEHPPLHLRLIVLGSRHVDCGDRKANRSVIYDRSGSVVWSQCKRESYTIPDDAKDHPGCSEWIETENAQQLMLTPIGSVAVQICLDFLPMDMRQALCELGCRFFLLPTMTGNLDSEFRRKAEDCGKLSGAVSAIANSRLPWLMEGKSPDDKDLRLLYGPIPTSKQPADKPVDSLMWIRYFA